MLRELMYKWFGLSDKPCESCELLREMLHKSESERKEMLHRLLDKDKPEPFIPVTEVEPVPITPQFVPWRVRQQMLEAEDAKRAQLLRDKGREIQELERELGVNPDLEAEVGVKS